MRCSPAFLVTCEFEHTHSKYNTSKQPSSFRHVLGVESDPQLVLAAKELKEKGELEYAGLGPGGDEVGGG